MVGLLLFCALVVLYAKRKAQALEAVRQLRRAALTAACTTPSVYTRNSDARAEPPQVNYALTKISCAVCRSTDMS